MLKVAPEAVMTEQICPDGKSMFLDGQEAGVPPGPWVFAQLGTPLTIPVGMHGLASPCPHRCKPRVPTYDTDKATLPGNWRSTERFHCMRYGWRMSYCVILMGGAGKNPVNVFVAPGLVKGGWNGPGVAEMNPGVHGPGL